MSGAKEIRTKIKSIKNTQKITRAMEMVAASKMRRAQDRMASSKPYAQRIREVIGHLATARPEVDLPYMRERPVKRTGLIVVTSDRGLCGGLNNNLLKMVVTHMQGFKDKNIEIDLCVIGNKGLGFFKRFGGNILAQMNHYGDAPELTDMIGAVKIMIDAFVDEEIDSLHVISNEFVNTMTQKPHMQQLLPFPKTEVVQTTEWDYVYEPEPEALLDVLSQRFIESQVYQAVVENIACEQAARMVAMKAASDNAAGLIDELQLVYNKARQAAITQEISEIISGAQAV